MKLAFIGGGTMAEAIIRGVLAGGVVGREDVSVGEVVEERRSYLRERYEVFATAANIEAAGRGDMVVLSVKPQDLPGVLSELGPSLRQDQAVLSIVAGVRMDVMMAGLAQDGAGEPSLIRAMPNTPAQIGEAVSMWTCSHGVAEKSRQLARDVLRTMGEEIYVADEKYLDMATALSASGPAYVFLFIEALIDGGVHVGLPRDMARTMALQTVLGSTKLAQETGRHPAELKAMVTSPGGTTAEGLLALEDGGLRATVVKAVIAAYEKARDLGS